MKALTSWFRSRRLYALTTVILCTAVIVCQARVFVRWASVSQGTRTLRALGGTPAYHTRVNLNGGEGTLAVFSFDEPIEQLVRRIAAAFDVPPPANSVRTMWRTSFRRNDNVVHMLALSLTGKDNALLFNFEQSAADFSASSEQPDHHGLKRVPEYPGSTPVFFAADRHTGMDVAVARTSAAAASVQGFYESALTSSGWIPVLAGMPLCKGMRVYLKRREICCVDVTSTDPRRPGSTITLLHKKHGMK